MPGKFPLLLLGCGLFAYGNRLRAEFDINIGVEGDVRTGVEYEKRKNGAHPYAETILEFSTKRREGFKAVVEAQGKTETRDLRLRDTFIDYKIDEKQRMAFGFTKKRLGSEYARSSWDQDLLKETLIYQKLEELTFVGRELQIRWFGAAEDKEVAMAPFELALGLPTSNSYNARVQKSGELGETLPYYNVGLLVQQHLQVYSKAQLVGATMLTLWGRKGLHGFEAEGMLGVDPFKSEISRLYGDKHLVYFTGMKSQYTYDFSARRQGWQASTSLSLLQNDLERALDRSVELVAGVSYYLKKTRVAANIILIGDQNPLAAGDWSQQKTRALLELRQEI